MTSIVAIKSDPIYAQAMNAQRTQAVSAEFGVHAKIADRAHRITLSILLGSAFGLIFDRPAYRSSEPSCRVERYHSTPF
jgi:hypothetical protein